MENENSRTMKCPETVRLNETRKNGHRYAVLSIGAEDEGRDVLFLLKNRLGLSSSRIGTVKFDPEGMLLNGVRVNVRAHVFPGDLLLIRTDDPPKKQRLIPWPVPLDILYEDDAVLAVDKPAGLVCHPSPGHAWDTLSNRVRAYYDDTAPDLQVHIAGRLDRDTSGVVLFSKNSTVSAALQREQYAGIYVKEYLAAVHGQPDPSSGIIRTRVDTVRDPASGLLLLKKAEDGAGQEAETAYEVLDQAEGFAILHVVIRTGRMHQIRFHMSCNGYPLLWDPLYGDAEMDAALFPGKHGRTALHAYRITLKHPENGSALTITSPVPDDLKMLFDAAGAIPERRER